MKNKNMDFQQIDILKERQKLRILQQEMKIRSGFTDLTNNLTGTALLKRAKDNLLRGSGLAFKLGFMAVTLIADRISKRKRRK
jgi:hypothetical protein